MATSYSVTNVEKGWWKLVFTVTNLWKQMSMQWKTCDMQWKNDTMGANFVNWNNIGEAREVVYVETFLTPDATHRFSPTRTEAQLPLGETWKKIPLDDTKAMDSELRKFLQSTCTDVTAMLKRGFTTIGEMRKEMIELHSEGYTTDPTIVPTFIKKMNKKALAPVLISARYAKWSATSFPNLEERPDVSSLVTEAINAAKAHTLVATGASIDYGEHSEFTDRVTADAHPVWWYDASSNVSFEDGLEGVSNEDRLADYELSNAYPTDPTTVFGPDDDEDV